MCGLNSPRAAGVSTGHVGAHVAGPVPTNIDRRRCLKDKHGVNFECKFSVFIVLDQPVEAFQRHCTRTDAKCVRFPKLVAYTNGAGTKTLSKLCTQNKLHLRATVRWPWLLPGWAGKKRNSRVFPLRPCATWNKVGLYLCWKEEEM